MKSETDKKLEAIYKRIIQVEQDPVLLKNLIDKNLIADDFVAANKQEILNRAKN